MRGNDLWRPCYDLSDPGWRKAIRVALERIGDRAPQTDKDILRRIVRGFRAKPQSISTQLRGQVAALAPVDGQAVTPGGEPRPSWVELVGQAPQPLCVAAGIVAHELGHAVKTSKEFARRERLLGRYLKELASTGIKHPPLECYGPWFDDALANMHACRWGFMTELRAAARHPQGEGPARFLPGHIGQEETEDGRRITLRLTGCFYLRFSVDGLDPLDKYRKGPERLRKGH